MHIGQKKPIILLVIILLISAFLRFYKLPEMANFDFDQEYASNFAYSVLKEYPIQLIGQGLSIQGLFMGPIYFYYLVPFYAFSNLHPIGGYIGSVVLGLITVFTYFWVGKKMFGTTAGLIAAFFRGILFSFIDIDWSMTPAFSSDIVVIATTYFFYRYWHNDLKSQIPLAFCLGLFTSLHPILFPFYLVFVIFLILKRKIPSLKITTFSIFAFLIPIFPLIRFEFLHSFLEVKQLFSLFGGQLTGYKDYISSLQEYLLVNIYEPYRIFGILNIPKTYFSVALFGILIFISFKKIGFWKDNFHKVFLLTTFIIFLSYYTFFPGHVSEYYFSAIGTLVVLYSAASASLLAKKHLPILFLIIIILSFFSLKTLSARWNNPALITLVHKDFIVKEILKRQPKNQEFFVSYIKNPGWNFGFDYLFKLYGHTPQTREVKPPIYTIVLPKALSEGPDRITSGNIHLILPPTK